MMPNPSKLIAVIAIFMAGDVNSFSIPRISAHRSIVKNESSVKPTTVRNTQLIKGTSTSLEAVPSWTYYSIGHIIGGSTGTPFVIRATKSWYRHLNLPSWTPPSGSFAPVWTVLYGLMGVSVSRIVKASSSSNPALKLWTLHYALNMVWPVVFFGLKQLRLGLMINLSLVTSLGFIIPLFHRIDPLSAYLLLPYLLWLSFANVLNLVVCRNNPDGFTEGMGGEDVSLDVSPYDDDMLESDIKKLQDAAAKYAGL